MADDVSLSDLGSASNPLPGLSASDYGGYGSGGNQISPDTGIGWGSAAALGVGALGIGALASGGPAALPPQFGQMNVPYLQQTGQGLVGQGQGLVGQGQSALAMAQHGELTPEQQAQLKVYSGGLTNQARQQFYNMGQNPDESTAFLSTTANIDAQVNAMAQQQIQTTIQLGLGEISGGNSLIGQGLGFESAANQALLQAAQAQMAADKDYSSSLTSAFSAIGTMFGAVFGGPAGAAAGGAAGKLAGGLFG